MVATQRLAQVASLPALLEAAGALLSLVTIPGRGRSLISSTDIPHGTVIHQESPMLCAPAAASREDCHGCLRPLGPPPLAADAAPQSPRFCSHACEADARAEWWDVGQYADFSALHAACASSAEKFPLLAARLACSMLQQQRHTNINTAVAEASHTGMLVRSSLSDILRGDPVQDLDQLCFANISQPPPEWADMHSLLLRGLQPLGLPLSALTQPWFSQVLARLHVNVFRVDTVPHMDLTSDPGALLRAAAAAMSGTQGAHKLTGSAVYLLGSMFNHSCEPNVDVTFPRNNAVVRFVAATDIPRHTELCISYVDTEAARAARQRHLKFAYGFDCDCVACRQRSERTV